VEVVNQAGYSRWRWVAKIGKKCSVHPPTLSKLGKLGREGGGRMDDRRFEWSGAYVGGEAGMVVVRCRRVDVDANAAFAVAAEVKYLSRPLGDRPVGGAHCVPA
jgi:hypothetical protein